AVGKNEMPFGKRPAHQAVRDDGEVTVTDRRELLNARPRAIDAGMKHRPRLTVRRPVVRREDVEAELGVGGAADIAEVTLLEEGIDGGGNADDVAKVPGGGHGAREVARHDLRDALASESPGQPFGLRDAARREGAVGTLDDASGIALRLAVTDQEDR